MKKQKKNMHVADRAAQRLELPKELVFGEPVITVTGRRELTVENYRGILEYDEGKIRLSLKHGQVEICGRELKIEYYTNDDMRISGYLDKLEYGM